MRAAAGAARAAGAAAGGGGEAVAQARDGDARGGQELLVIEGDDLRAALGLEVALEIGRDVDGRDGVAGADRPRRRGEIAGALDDAEAGRRRHLLHEGARGLRSVLVDDDHAEPADHRMTEGRGQDRRRRTAARRRSGSAPRDRAAAIAIRAWRPARIRASAAGLIGAPASPDRRSCRAAAPAPCRPGRRGSRRCAGRNRRWRGWRASSHIRPWWRSA